MRQIWLLIIFGLLFFGTVFSSFSQEDPNCLGAPIPQLVVGGFGRVTEGDSNNLRDQASRNGTKIGEIPAGGIFTVLEGAVCTDGFNWWRVDYDGLVGWTVEGSGTDYFVLPYDPSVPTATPTITPSPSPTPQAVPPLSETYPLSLDNPITVGMVVRVDADGLRLRAMPSTNAAVMGQIADGGETVTIIGDSIAAEGYIWWQVRQENGSEGWIVESFFVSAASQYRAAAYTPNIFPPCPYIEGRISFVAHPYLYTSAPDGSERCVLAHLDTATVYTTWGDFKYWANRGFWSPDGQELLYIVRDGLYSVSVDARERHLITDRNVTWLDWSPDSQRLALAMNNQAWVMNRDGTNPVRASNVENPVEYVAWYPDGQTIFFMESIPDNPNAIQTGTRTSYIFHSVGRDLSHPRVLFRLEEEIEMRDLEMSPDGAYLVAVITSLDEYDSPEGIGTYLIDMQSFERELISPTWANWAWSVDGRYLAINDDIDNAILDIETGERTSLGDSFYPESWSIDGERLYSTEGIGFSVYEVATGNITAYLEDEARPLESTGSLDFGYGISSIFEQGMD